MSGFSSAVLAANPVAYWRLDDAASPLADATGNGHSAAVTGSPVYQVAGLIPGDTDTAIQLNGSSYANPSVPLFSMPWAPRNGSTGPLLVCALLANFKTSTLPGAGNYEIVATYGGFSIALNSSGHLGFMADFTNVGQQGFYDVGDGVNYCDGNAHRIIVNCQYQNNNSGTATNFWQWNTTWYIDSTTGHSSAVYTPWSGNSTTALSPTSSWIGSGISGASAFTGVVDEVAYFENMNLSNAQIGTIMAPPQAQSIGAGANIVRVVSQHLSAGATIIASGASMLIGAAARIQVTTQRSLGAAAVILSSVRSQTIGAGAHVAQTLRMSIGAAAVLVPQTATLIIGAGAFLTPATVRTAIAAGAWIGAIATQVITAGARVLRGPKNTILVDRKVKVYPIERVNALDITYRQDQRY